MKSWYVLDPRNRIVSAGGDWDSFAAENDSPQAVIERVVGRSLEEFVSGLETQLYLASLFQLCREAETAHVFLYRCDAPWMARLFQMTVGPGDEPGGLRLTHELIRARAAADGDGGRAPAARPAPAAHQAAPHGAAAHGAAAHGAAAHQAASHGAASDGAASDGAASHGAASHGAGSHEGASRCSICNAVKLGDTWHEVRARPETRWFVSAYALCPRCAEHDPARRDERMLRIFDAVPPRRVD